MKVIRTDRGVVQKLVNYRNYIYVCVCVRALFFPPFNIMIDTLSRTITPLVDSPLLHIFNFTQLHFTSFHLNFTQLHFTTLSFGFTPFKFPIAYRSISPPHHNHNTTLLGYNNTRL